MTKTTKSAQKQFAEDTRRMLDESYRLAVERILTKLTRSRDADDEHPYLLDHDVPNYDLSLDRRGNLLGVGVDLEASFTDSAYIPKAQNLLTITREGAASLEMGAKLHGAALLIGHREFRLIAKAPQEPHEILLAKDYSAGAALHRDTERPVAVFFEFSNLGSVAHIFKRKFPKARLVIFAGERFKNSEVRRQTWETAKAVGAVIAPYKAGLETGLDAFTVADMGFIPESPYGEALGAGR